MSYDYPTKKYAISADVDAVATLLAQRQSDSGTTNGGIVASGSPAVPQLGVDVPNLGISYLKAISDVNMSTRGFQSQTTVTGGSSSTTTSSSFADITGLPTISFTAAAAMTYLVHCEIAGFFQSSGTSGILFQLVNTSSGFTTRNSTWIAYPPAINVRTNISVRIPMQMVAGVNSHKLQWACAAGGQTANVDTGCTWAATFAG